MKFKPFFVVAIGIVALSLASESMAQSCCAVPRLAPKPDTGLLGKKAPNLEFETLAGEKLTLNDFKNRTVLLEFCSAESGLLGEQRLRELGRLAQKYQDAAFTVICMVFGDNNLETLEKEYGLANTPIVLVRGNAEVTQKLQATSLPASILIGRDRKIKEVATSVFELAKIDRRIPEVLAKS